MKDEDSRFGRRLSESIARKRAVDAVVTRKRQQELQQSELIKAEYLRIIDVAAESLRKEYRRKLRFRPRPGGWRLNDGTFIPYEGAKSTIYRSARFEIKAQGLWSISAEGRLLKDISSMDNEGKLVDFEDWLADQIVQQIL